MSSHSHGRTNRHSIRSNSIDGNPITFVTILASTRGLQALGKVFPGVKVIVAGLDETLAGEGSVLAGRWLGV